MSQGALQLTTTPPLPGTTGVPAINTALAALASMSSGTSAPTLGPGASSALVKGQEWLDTTTATANLRKLYDGAQWLPWLSLDATNHAVRLTPGDGAVGSPAFSFSGDTDTGIYRIGANNIGVAVNGVKVLDIGAAVISCPITTPATAIGTAALVLPGGLSVAKGMFVTNSGFNPGANVTGAITMSGAFGGGFIWADTAYVGMWAQSAGTEYYLAVGGTSGGWATNQFVLTTSVLTVTGVSTVLGAPTGGAKGAGTLNATAVYDDNVLLTCMGIEYALTGKMDVAKWDAFVPDRVEPERTVFESEMQDVQIASPERIKTPEGYVERIKITTESRPRVDLIPVWDAAGNGIGVHEEPIGKEIIVPEKRTPREHVTARYFKSLIDSGFDPRDPKQFIAKMKADRALPGMPTQEEWEHAGMSVGEIHNRLWLSVELLATAFAAHIEQG